MQQIIWTDMKGVVPMQTPTFNPGGWKTCKQEYTKFVKHYNLEKPKLALSPYERKALENLHKLWEAAKKPKDSHIQYYYYMKEFEAVLDAKLSEDPVWASYSKTIKGWRLQCLASNFNSASIPFEEASKSV